MRKEIGKYLIDISKLVLGGVVLSSILTMEDTPKAMLLLGGLVATFVLAIFGFSLIKKKEEL